MCELQLSDWQVRIRNVMKQWQVLLAIVTLLGACSIHSTGVGPRGEDRYTVTHVSGSALVSNDSLTADAMEEGADYCAEKQRKLKFIRSEETPLGFGQWAESEVEFNCE
jgi:hypothetical protein